MVWVAAEALAVVWAGALMAVFVTQVARAVPVTVVVRGAAGGCGTASMHIRSQALSAAGAVCVQWT